jgi:hypothetical protein
MTTTPAQVPALPGRVEVVLRLTMDGDIRELIQSRRELLSELREDLENDQFHTQVLDLTFFLIRPAQQVLQTHQFEQQETFLAEQHKWLHRQNESHK